MGISLKDLMQIKRHRNQRHLSFRRYAEPFFDWDRCPHIRRLREEGKSITRRHARIQRQRLKRHILSDPFAGKQMSEITRADVLDLRSRLLAKCSPVTVNKALGMLYALNKIHFYPISNKVRPGTKAVLLNYSQETKLFIDHVAKWVVYTRSFAQHENLN